MQRIVLSRLVSTVILTEDTVWTSKKVLIQRKTQKIETREHTCLPMMPMQATAGARFDMVV